MHEIGAIEIDLKCLVTSGAPDAHFFTNSRTFVARSLTVRTMSFRATTDRVTLSDVLHLLVPGISKSTPALILSATLYTPNLCESMDQIRSTDSYLAEQFTNRS